MTSDEEHEITFIAYHTSVDDVRNTANYVRAWKHLTEEIFIIWAWKIE